MAIIATWSEGHASHGEIVDWANDPWCAGEQYKDERFAFVLFDLPEDARPVRISSFGPVSSHEFSDGNGSVSVCDRVYASAIVDCEVI